MLAALRERAPVCWVPALGGWLVTSRDAVVEVLDDPVAFTVDDPRFTTAAVVGPSMLSLDGDEHTRHRRPFAAGFRPSLVASQYAPATRELAEALVAAVRADGRVEVRRGLAGPLAAGVVTGILGLTGVDARVVLDWYAAIVAAVSALSAGEPAGAAGARAATDLAAHVRRTVEDPAAAGMLAAAARPPYGLDAAEVAANAAVLMFGGIETVEGMVANAVLHVLSAPDPLQVKRSGLENAVEESLRLEPAAARVDRYTTRDVVLAGVRIPAGDLVVASIGAANRDPAVFPDPDRYDPARPNARLHLAFARGPHVCVAAGLARAQAAIALEVLLDLPGVRLDAGASTAPAGLVFRKADRVVVRWDV
ncbi:cytochrome P450 [Kineosporia sp. R_H_3]|uniref:cytochrome P450 n=1 Tax=Kineosporia sp. R_H_3 TaxID=1961848 RepID=UPI001E4D59C0|nr:cytochrome P450 [Kineosporia sp. R_H_3]